ncbi:MAG: hypothetical protein E7311_03405 [Clostridiales bacterium]|nr:hypothetical protein [Clostridiales bacterium]
MKRNANEIMSAKKPSDIFSMNPDTIEQEKDDYIEQFKPKAYNTIQNFLIQQQVTLLYRQALNEFKKGGKISLDTSSIVLTDISGNTIEFCYNYTSNMKIGTMYVTDKNVLFVINSKYEKYYKNYISKTKHFPKLDKKMSSIVQYMLPKVSKHFETNTGDFVIILDKPCTTIYPLRELLNYFDGKIKSEYVASILTRLYYFVSYLDLIGITHNAITVDNLFFSPGKTVEEGSSFTVEDMRIVGVFGGWFFSTSSHEKICGLPKEIHEILPHEVKLHGYSSFKVDELSIKKVARELLGDSTGNNLENVPEAFSKWINNNSVALNSYEEFKKWEKVIIQSYGKHRFVDMDVSID